MVYSVLSTGAQGVWCAQIASANSHYWWLRGDEYSAFLYLSSSCTCSLSLSEGVRKGHLFQRPLSWRHDFQLRTKKSFDRHFQFIHYFTQLSVHIKNMIQQSKSHTDIVHHTYHKQTHGHNKSIRRNPWGVSMMWCNSALMQIFISCSTLINYWEDIFFFFWVLCPVAQPDPMLIISGTSETH